jgi:methyl-accepting chemotaxis protein WspA
MGTSLGFRGKLFGLVGLVAVGLIVLIIVTQFTIRMVKVEGPLYQQIVDKKALSNELMPARLTVRHMYMLLYKVSVETDKEMQRKWIDQYLIEEQEFRTLANEWLEKTPSGPIRSALDREVYGLAKEFFDTVRAEFLPAAEAYRADPAKLPQVHTALRGKLRDLYLRQMAACTDLAKMNQNAVTTLETEVRDSIGIWNAVLIICGVVVLGLSLLVGWLTARNIVGQTNALLKQMQDMAGGGGDLTVRVPVKSDDEIGRLSKAINQVIQNVHDLVVKVREASLSLYTTSTQIAATSREQEATMQNLGTNTNQIAAAVKEISATSSELTNTVNGVNEGAKQTGSLARTGRTGLAKMSAQMQRLAESTGGIAAKLSAVREKANDINVVVTTITKVADQTNLLSINAAIEAEKAGEYGRGFLVVAREIRRLADQTAVATLDIENMVRQMQTAVSAGVMEMDKFTEEVRMGVSGVNDIGGQMGQIIEQVQELNERFQAVNEGTAQQSAGAKQINDAMLQLAAGVQQSTAAAKEFYSVTEGLRTAADTLRELVARFKVAG